MSDVKDKTLYERYVDAYKAYVAVRDDVRSKEDELIRASSRQREAKCAYDDARIFLEAYLDGRLDHFGKPVESSNAN